MNKRTYGRALFALLGFGAADLVALNAWALPAVFSVNVLRPATSFSPATSAPPRVDSVAPDREVAQVAPIAQQDSQEPPPQPAPALSRDPARILFHKGTWWVGPASRRAIHLAHSRIRSSRIIELEGHADASGPSKINQRISEKRAAAVEALLIAKGVAPERIRVRAFGETRATGSVFDRRVEIWTEP
jgi:outer membrane protein OmpA-like peptidoglycan-associated protein